MRAYVLKRVITSTLTVFVVASLLFILFRLMPGDPTAIVEGPALDPSVRAEMRKLYGLDRPLYEQYFIYITNAATLSFGESFFQNRPVREIVLYRAVNTFSLMGTAYLLAYLIGVPVGALAGWWRNSKFDMSAFTIGIIIRGTPVFLMGLLVLYTFAYYLEWLPLGGMYDPNNVYDSRIDMFLSLDFARHVFLPVLAMTPFLMSYPMLLMRTSILKTKGEDYIKMAKARGIEGKDVFVKHGMRNSILPIVTAVPLSLGYAVAGSVLIEVVFSWPGLGRTLVRAVYMQDYPLAQGAFVMIALIVIFGNLFADMAYAYLDPRITYGGRE